MGIKSKGTVAVLLMVPALALSGCSKTEEPIFSVRVEILNVIQEYQDHSIVEYTCRNTGTGTILLTDHDFRVDYAGGTSQVVESRTYWQEQGEMVTESFNFSTGDREVIRVTHSGQKITPY